MIKKKLVIFSLLTCVCFFIVGWLLIEYFNYPNRKKGLTPFVGTMNKVEKTFYGTFRAEYSEPHFIGIAFQKEITDLEIKRKVDNWRDITLHDEEKLPGPDLFWIIENKNKIVEQGDGRRLIHSLNGDALVLGEFNAKSGQVYQIKIIIGPQFKPFIKASPIIEVGVSTVAISIGLEWEKIVLIPISIFLGIIGSIFLFLFLKYLLK